MEERNNIDLTEGEKLHGKWFIMYKKIDDNFDPKNINFDNLNYIHAPSNHFYADPFCIKHNDLYYIFLETFDYKKGTLAYFTIDEDMKASEIKDITGIPSPHLSYPHVFKENDKFYMIPETCHLNKINLYECVSFPNEWKLNKTLIDDVHTGDNTILKHNDKYWMFTTVYKNGLNNFCIFYSDTIFGPWRKHSKVNVEYKQEHGIKNEHLTRSAGNIFKTSDGKIIRPSQHSDRGINGESVTLYEIIKLTEDDYHEQPINIVSKELVPQVRAMHTFSVKDGLMLIDGRLERDTDEEYKKINTKKEMERIENTNFYVDHSILEQAFKCNTSGNGRCYYSINIDNKFYDGERNWDTRWDLVKNCMEFEGKKVLELGCNMGILLTYLKKFRNINSAVGVDEPDEMLISSNKRDTIKAAKLLTQGFGIDNIEFKQLDLNNVNYEELLGTDFDIAIAMSILKWITDDERFLKYLSNFKNVLYEGHDSNEVEISRFAKYGFSHTILGETQTGKSYDPNHTRTLILFSK